MNNSLAEVHPELVSEWSEKNLLLTPDGIIGTGQKHRQQGEQHRTKEDHRRCADGGDACIQLGGAQDNRHQNSANAIAQQQPRRNADQTKHSL